MLAEHQQRVQLSQGRATTGRPVPDPSVLQPEVMLDGNGGGNPKRANDAQRPAAPQLRNGRRLRSAAAAAATRRPRTRLHP